MDGRPLQEEEISSSNNIFVAEQTVSTPPELQPHTSHGAPIFILVPPPQEFPVQNIAFIEQIDYLRNLANYICESAERRTAGYEACTEEDWVRITICNVTVTFTLDYEAGCTTLRCSHLKNLIGLPELHYVFAASILFDYIMKAWKFHIMLFNAQSELLSRGFPTKKLTVDMFRFDTSKENAEEVLARWMPHVESVSQMVIGNVLNLEQHRKALRLYRTFFHGKVYAWAGEFMAVPVINDFRRILANTSLQKTNVPIGQVFRWIKGWIVGLPGYTHMTQVYYFNPLFRLHRGVFRVFLKIKEDNMKNDDELIIKSFDGKCARLEITSFGALRFKLLYEFDEASACAVNRDPTKLPFSTDDLEDVPANYHRYLQLDMEQGRNVAEYAHPVVMGGL